MASKGEGEGSAPIDPAAVREQVARIVASRAFPASGRGRQILQYVVEESLEGRCVQLNAHTIALAMFGRDASFDARNDPVVGVEVGHLRGALERYYLLSGSHGPVRITIPEGGYSPRFEVAVGGYRTEQQLSTVDQAAHDEALKLQHGSERPVGYRDLILPIGVPAIFGAMAILALIRPLEAYLAPTTTSPVPSASASKEPPKIIVEPLAALDKSSDSADVAKGLTDQLIAELTKAGGIVVHVRSEAVGKQGGSSFRLQGSTAVEDDILRLDVRLLNSANGTQVWAKEYHRDLRAQTILDVEDEIAAEVAQDIVKNHATGSGNPA